jgi:bifunctional non-homologous end joining protein LigD
MIVRRSSGFIEPCLPSRAARPPSGSGWLHEIKQDGYRLMVRR